MNYGGHLWNLKFGKLIFKMVGVVTSTPSILAINPILASMLCLPYVQAWFGVFCTVYNERQTVWYALEQP